MFLRLLLESFRRQRRSKLLAGTAILFGTTAVTAMLALATTIGDRIHKELAVYGANIVVTPKAAQLAVNLGGLDIQPVTAGAFLHESDLAKLKTIFWANNITGISPELPLQVIVDPKEDSVGAMRQGRRVGAVGLWFGHKLEGSHGLGETGAPALHPWWKIEGRWPEEGSSTEIAIGSKLRDAWLRSALNPLTVDGREVRIVGVVTTGDALEGELFLPLTLAQSLSNQPDAVSRVEISARTKPEDAFKDPATLSPAQYEIWHCRPYANSIADDIQRAIPNSRAEQVRQVEQTEGTVLHRISGLMALISAAALLAAGFAVSAAMATAILERRAEIGLMRSLGASKAAIALLFYAETGILALFAGTLGSLLGSVLAATLGAHIFADTTPLASQLLIPALLPITVGTALLVALAGSTPSIRAALRLDPSTILRANA